ncbi:hypothetical protein EKH79_02275 [Dyella dinghuensis]|uniref:Uncharacterized protein n=1 Tax=Dyella dinghuensis TaxID=1920169 RepID=A0A432LX69_9GAMM|nr:hypothetical protein EKH79_02275 [Dyella dinghuensis]
MFTQTLSGPPPAAGVVDGADFIELLLEVLVLLAAAGAAAAVLLLALLDVEPDELDVELDEPLADLLMPLCPRQAPFVVATVCEVPSLHWTVVPPLDAAACACTPGAAIITAAAITAINPNVFIAIPSSLNSPDAASARPQTDAFPPCRLHENDTSQAPCSYSACVGNYA